MKELCNQYNAFELEEARACAPADLVRGNSEDVETNSATGCIMKDAPTSHHDHQEAGNEVGFCQHEAYSRQLEAFQAESLPTVQSNILVLDDQYGKFEAAVESKSLSSSEDSSLSHSQKWRSNYLSKGTLVHYWIIRTLESKFEEALQVKEYPCSTTSPVARQTFGFL